MVKILDKSQDNILDLLKKGQLTISVVGLGYVGLPLAVLFALEGAKVIGCDINDKLVKKISRGESPIIEHDITDFVEVGGKISNNTCPRCSVLLIELHKQVFCPHCLSLSAIKDGNVRMLEQTYDVVGIKEIGLGDYLKKAIDTEKLKVTTDVIGAIRDTDVVLITVGTPIDDQKRPNTQPLVNACHSIGKGLAKGSLVILKSTVSPGTTENLVKPIIENESGLRAGIDFGLAHMPERVLEGLALFEFRTLTRNVGGINKKSADLAAYVFSVFPSQIHVFENPKITETAKLFENIYRDVNIALVNELAMACDNLGVDIIKAIGAACTDPKTHLLIPGPGVGGYCLPKDTYYLVAPSKEKGFNPELIVLARRINDDMHEYISKLVDDALADAGMNVKGTKIAILGLAFKRNSGDLRNTPVLPLVDFLLKRGALLTGHDPLVDIDEAKLTFTGLSILDDLDDAIKNIDCIIVVTDHNEYRRLSVKEIVQKAKYAKVIVDTRHIFDPDECKNAGLIYRGIGRGYSR
jgi:UDP-N-acetyl-D-mannosaminuronic acid dehydrogenase